MQSSNDDFFDPRAQLLSLTESEAIEYARNFFDDNCAGHDAAYLSDVITAGGNSQNVTYQHAIGGSPAAQLTYGVAKLHGLHTDQSTSEGLFWLLRAFNNGNAKAAIVLAGAYTQGEHIAPDARKALKYATYAAENGLPSGQFLLANLLVGGGDIPEDQEKAIELLQEAARSGYAPARQMLQDNDLPLE
jgi:TPR repeat protein